MRKHMEEKATQKLLSRYGREPLLVVMGIIFPTEREVTIGESRQPVIGDSNAVRVSG